ncbi:Membrane endopeptidase, M50 family [Granulibacter bethesdensis]|uniref:Zinc metalloprotease n=1 Tax=Granulibacter bethesdensis TaxID=364410 RepID=A0AAN0VFQ1_9PROT|nr:RIP metalloprotease RseP [Granulibacter bethesdensis]AHJ62769.1 Membrane endopeptidase, M50 family [Granulibacter bethesdensis]
MLPETIRTVLSFVIVLGVLVFVHEMGHYLAARISGIYIEAFSIGFGKPLVKWRDRRGCEWRLCWLPLGGYVKMYGMERPGDNPGADQPVNTGSPSVQPPRPGMAFFEKSVGSRAFVVAAGPLANALLAIVLFAALFMTAGRQIPLPVVGEVLPQSAAAEAGLQHDDRIVAIDGMQVSRFEDIQHSVVGHPNQRLVLSVERGGKEITIPVTPHAKVADGLTIGVLGIGAGAVTVERMAPGQAIVQGVAQTWTETGNILSGVWQMITGQRSAKELGGPLAIARISGQVAQLGIPSLISLMALLSINLGLINLFPIPILDGGHLVFFLIEAIRGRPMSTHAQEYGLKAGFLLLATLFVFVTWNDLARMGLFRWFSHLIG